LHVAGTDLRLIYFGVGCPAIRTVAVITCFPFAYPRPSFHMHLYIYIKTVYTLYLYILYTLFVSYVYIRIGVYKIELTLCVCVSEANYFYCYFENCHKMNPNKFDFSTLPKENYSRLQSVPRSISTIIYYIIHLTRAITFEILFLYNNSERVPI